MRSGKPLRTAVVLQGGGALGAFECGVLRALYGHREDFRPAVITGISIGAVNAAILAGAGIEALERAWRDRFALRGPPLPGSPLGPLAALWQPVYEQVLPRQAQQYLAFLGKEGMYRVRPEYLYAGPAGLPSFPFPLAPTRSGPCPRRTARTTRRAGGRRPAASASSCLRCDEFRNRDAPHGPPAGDRVIVIARPS
jgi:hypothetical protein